jgi:hypothetical protein
MSLPGRECQLAPSLHGHSHEPTVPTIGERREYRSERTLGVSGDRRMNGGRLSTAAVQASAITDSNHCKAANLTRTTSGAQVRSATLGDHFQPPRASFGSRPSPAERVDNPRHGFVGPFPRLMLQRLGPISR